MSIDPLVMNVRPSNGYAFLLRVNLHSAHIVRDPDADRACSKCLLGSAQPAKSSQVVEGVPCSEASAFRCRKATTNELLEGRRHPELSPRRKARRRSERNPKKSLQRNHRSLFEGSAT